jgi:hypothetical protein
VSVGEKGDGQGAAISPLLANIYLHYALDLWAERWRRRRRCDHRALCRRFHRCLDPTARRYGISRTLLLQWRRSFRVEQKGGAEQQIGFVPAVVVPLEEEVPAPAGSANDGVIEIEFATGARMRVTGTVDQVP